jgi:hypothetical protein
MDFVYLCRSGENEELRYSIRSVLWSFPDARIWLVGDKPKWYVGDSIRVVQNSGKYTNALNNLNAICASPDISEDFILMNDDFFIMKKMDSIGIFHGGFLSDKIENYERITRSSSYINKLIATNNRVKQCKIPNPIDYELHVPMPMEKGKLLKILESHGKFLWRSMYGNIYNLGGDQIEDVKVYNHRLLEARQGKNPTELFLSTEDNSFEVTLRNRIAPLFKTPSRYENS